MITPLAEHLHGARIRGNYQFRILGAQDQPNMYVECINGVLEVILAPAELDGFQVVIHPELQHLPLITLPAKFVHLLLRVPNQCVPVFEMDLKRLNAYAIDLDFPEIDVSLVPRNLPLLSKANSHIGSSHELQERLRTEFPDSYPPA